MTRSTIEAVAHSVTLIPGDGIGPEVAQSARAIVAASGAAVEWELAEAGMRIGEQTGTRRMTEAIVEKLAKR